MRKLRVWVVERYWHEGDLWDPIHAKATSKEANALMKTLPLRGYRKAGLSSPEYRVRCYVPKDGQ